MMKTGDVVPHIQLPVLPPIMAHSIVHSEGETALRDWNDHMRNLFTTIQEKLDSSKDKYTCGQKDLCRQRRDG